MRYLFIVSGIVFFIGCSNSSAPSRALTLKKVKLDKEEFIVKKTPNKSYILKIEAVGKGVPPCSGSCSSSQSKLMARRAAIISAYRNLAEKIYGIRVNGSDTIRNMALTDSTVKAYVEGLIRGASIVREDYDGGVYTIVLGLKIDIKRWNKFLSKNNIYPSRYEGY